MSIFTLERTDAQEKRPIAESLKRTFGKIGSSQSISTVDRRPTELRQTVDALPKSQVDRILSFYVAEAEVIEKADKPVPDVLADRIDDSVTLLIETMPPETRGQLAVTALAGAFHVTGNQLAINEALESIEKSPTLQQSIAEPIVNAVEHVAKTGESISDSLRAEREKSNRAIGMRVKQGGMIIVQESPPVNAPLGPEYDWLYDRSAHKSQK